MMAGPLLPRSRSEVIGLVPVTAALLAVLAGLLLGFRLPAEFTVSAWPESFFGFGLRLMTDRVSWLFQLVLSIAAAAVFLTSLSRPGGPRVGSRAAGLVLTAVAMAAVQAQNLVTLAITWAVMDGVYFISLLLLARGERIESQATLSLTLNVLATFCVIAAAVDVLHNGQTTFLLGTTILSDRATLLLLLAALFRLGIFPFHLAISNEGNIRQGLGTLLRLAPAAVAFDLLTHVVVVSAKLPMTTWLSLAACLGLFVGALQLWFSSDPRHGLSYVILAQSSLGLLTALWGGTWAGTGVLATGLSTILGGTILFLNNGYNESERRWSIPTFVGVLVMLGGPLTVGFIGNAIMYSGFLASGAWWLFLICVIGQIWLAAAYIRLVLWPGEPMIKAEPIVSVAYLFGLIAPILAAVVGGVAVTGLTQSTGAPTFDLFGLPTLSAFGALIGAALAGFGLWRFESVVRARAQSLATVASAAQLGWLYPLFWELYRAIGRMLRTTADILEGEGGVLWTIVAALLVWLLFRSA